MSTLIMVLIVVAIVGGAVALVVIGMRDSRRGDALQERLAEFAASGESATLEEIEKQYLSR